MTEEKTVRKPTTIEQAEFSRNVWFVKPETTVTIEDMLKPDFWAHISRNMKSGDRIEVLPEDKHYFAEFFIMAASTNWAKVILMRKVDLVKDNEDSEVSGFIVKWAGPNDKWRVQNGNDVISKGHEDKETASQWLAEHLKSIR
jgi:hypothetical protein